MKKIELSGNVEDWEIVKVGYSMVYLPEISKFAVQKHEYNGSNSPVYFNTREEVLNFIKSLPLKV